MIINKILRFFLYWPFRITTTCSTIPFEPLKNLKIDKNKEIVYITVSSSVGNIMSIERAVQKLGLPSPFQELNLLGEKIPRICALRAPGLFSKAGSKKHDMEPVFRKWYEFYQRTNKDIQVIPITVLWSRNPGYETLGIHGMNAATPSFKKFFNLIFAGRDNCTIFCGSFNISESKERFENSKFSKDLNRTFKLIFIQKARAVVGKPLPNRKQVIEEILERPAVLEQIAVECKKTGKSEPEMKNKAREILEVMVADTRYPLLRFFNSIVSTIWSKIYQGQTVIGVDKVRQLVQTGHEIIYIPCHRSHMDYILLTFVLFHEGLPLPQIASGDNLNFFPVGQIIRRCGSYFIRRKMKGDDFYITIFREYLSLLFENGYATEFFIEGGRSRTGRTLPPRTGMVAMTVQSQLRGSDRPIAFIPTYLGYEHVTEVGSYMRELVGEAKKKESAMQLLGIFKRFRNYGRGYVTFGEPVVVHKFLNENVPGWKNDIDPKGTARPSWLNDIVNQLAHRIIINLNDSATINGINLCALAIMNVPDHTMSISQLEKCISMYLKILNVDPRRRATIPTASPMTLIRQAMELKKFRLYDVGDDMKFVRPSYGQTLQLTYFQNNIVHLFALPALLANIILRNGHILHEDVRSHARSLFYFLRHELFAPVDEKDLDNLIDKHIENFLNEGYITRDKDMLFVSGDGYQEFYILSRCIYHNLVRYLVAVTALKDTEDGKSDVPEFIEKCLSYSKRLPVEVTNNSPEFADPILFKIMCATFIRHSYFYVKEDGKLYVNEPKVQKLNRAATPLLGARDVKILNGQTLSRKVDDVLF
ncbi:glycerol-3-phosphate 1-O-acyltransferase PlsB [Succinivibrio dextrinosolvens]|uniref:glycerol-3-phosphate 1-O-acyltransferase PlsB n=1 Tax=Succinivibrio dextrinosolvens TaxID=83771 RepID=UPI00241E2AD8|nr:glycerol-3-phosphate 1-O-acyltransferase PlsB [Succinivibrio dextrinosolvens]MBE6423576.1 glycerol-3-phosphate 1-O-acyltransferase PlsB [Succinivibrio dextrinosolvens]